MIKLFRNIRKNLLHEGKTANYLKYAIGEIILVVIGILIALQINNWNEQKKGSSRMLTNIYSISEDLQADIVHLQSTINSLQKQVTGGSRIIPVMESKDQFIADSLQFILDFNALTSTPIMTKGTTTWDFLNSSGVLSEFPDTELLKMLQDYYDSYNGLATNFTNSANPVRLELRKLKYELFTDSEHRKFFPTDSPIAPKPEVYMAIFEDKRILPMCRFIGSTATYFEDRFKSLEFKAEKIINYIDQKYK